MLSIQVFAVYDAGVIDREIFGRFPDYLMSVAKVGKCDTNLGYVSKIKTLLEKDFVDCKLFSQGKWYTNLRLNVEKRYFSRCQAQGTKMTDSAPPMLVNDLLTLSIALFRRNTRESHANRCLLNLQWTTLGRISEVSQLRCNHLSYGENQHLHDCFLLIEMSRSKVGVQDTLRVYLHAKSWEICPLHSLAAHIVVNAPTVDLFACIPLDGEAKHVNSMLANLTQTVDASADLTAHLTSHSTRSGPAEYANEHPDIQSQYVVPRGGWELGGMQTYFTYISGTYKTDSRCGRALSGWPNANEGGHCPGIAAVPAHDHELFRTYSFALLNAAGLPVKLTDALMAVLLLYYDEVCSEYDTSNCLLLCRMHSAGVSATKLSEWSKCIRTWFTNHNSMYTVSMQDASRSTDVTVPVQNIAGFMDRCLRTNKATNDTVVNLADRFTQLENTLQRALSQQQTRSESHRNDSSAYSVGSHDNNSLFDWSSSSIVHHQQHNEHSTDIRTHIISSRPNSSHYIHNSSHHAQSDSHHSHSTSTSSNVVTVSALHASADLINGDLKGLTLQSLFYRWYAEETHKLSYPFDKDSRERHNRLAKALSLMKRFVPDDTIIPSRPAPHNMTDLLPWTEHIRTLSHTVDRKINEFCNEKVHERVNYEIELGKRKRKVSSKFWGMQKKLCGISLDLFPQPLRVVDSAWLQ